MNRRTLAFVTATSVLAVALLVLQSPPAFAQRWEHYVAWVVICLISETMWSNTLTGDATWSVASTAGLSAVVLLGPEAGMLVSGVSTWIADLFLQRKEWYKALFNGSQSTLSAWVAGMAFTALGGRAGLPLVNGVAELDRTVATALVLPFVGLVLAYFALNRASVATVVAWSSGRPFWRVLREDWLYLAKLEVDTASFLLVPLVVISFTAVGYPGVLLFYAPLFMLFQSDRRYLELKRAEAQNLRNAAFAAKGEIAGGIGHNLKNMLVGIQNPAQLIRLAIQNGRLEDAQRHALKIEENAKRISEVASWLQDYKRAGVDSQPLDLNALILRTVDLVKGDKRLNGVAWDVELDDHLPTVQGQSGMLQDVFVNLFLNAADAMSAQETPRKISVQTEFDSGTRDAIVRVIDSGPGISAENLPRMFRPTFTTKPNGHGFGLSTAQRSIEGHGGRISVTSPPGSGAQFMIQLPLQRPAGER